MVQEYVPLAVATPAVPATFAFMVFKQKAPAFLTDDLLGLLTYSVGRHDDFNLTKVAEEVGFEGQLCILSMCNTNDIYIYIYLFIYMAIHVCNAGI